MEKLPFGTLADFKVDIQTLFALIVGPIFLFFAQF